MPYAILRFQKRKAGSVASCERHNERKKRSLQEQSRYRYGTLKRQLPPCTAAQIHLQKRNQPYGKRSRMQGAA